MKRLLTVIVGLAACAIAQPGLAMDCAKAANPAETLICGDKGLLEADAAMAKAYEDTLAKAPDDEIRAMLVESQKRWLAARDKGLESVLAEPGALPEGVTPAGIAADVIGARADVLTGADGEERPTVVAAALDQRAFITQFSGGPYAGFSVSCSLLPPDMAYGCFSLRRYQNGDRICMVQDDWASGSVTTQRFVANVVEGQPKLVASCSFGGQDTPCPGGIDPQGGWNASPKQNPALFENQSLPKLDSEVGDDEERQWISQCLTEKDFPAVAQ